MEARLVQMRTLLANAAKHPKVKQQMEKYGYTAARILEGQALLDQVTQWQAEKENCYSQRNALKRRLEGDTKALKTRYMEHLTVARFVFRNDAYMQAQLQLTGTRKSDWAGWTTQVLSFYNRLEVEGTNLMKKHGTRPEEVAQGKAMIDALIATYQQKKSNAGDAQSSTQKRNEVFRSLSRWVSDFKKVARVALQDDPQLLETLGIVVPSVR